MKTHLAAFHFTLKLEGKKEENSFLSRNMSGWIPVLPLFRFICSATLALNPEENQLALANDDPLSKAHFSCFPFHLLVSKEKENCLKIILQKLNQLICLLIVF